MVGLVVGLVVGGEQLLIRLLSDSTSPDTQMKRT